MKKDIFGQILFCNQQYLETMYFSTAQQTQKKLTKTFEGIFLENQNLD